MTSNKDKINSSNGVVFKRQRIGSGYHSYYAYVAKRNGFKIRVSAGDKERPFYALINHTKKDIRWNSLWQSLWWDSLEKAIEYCSNWDNKNHACLGDDHIITVTQ